jgi:hypothetical protein
VEEPLEALILFRQSDVGKKSVGLVACVIFPVVKMHPKSSAGLAFQRAPCAATARGFRSLLKALTSVYQREPALPEHRTKLRRTHSIDLHMKSSEFQALQMLYSPAGTLMEAVERAVPISPVLAIACRLWLLFVRFRAQPSKMIAVLS